MQLTPNKPATLLFTLRVGDVPLDIPAAAVVTARLFDPDTGDSLSGAVTLARDAIGANWRQGVVVVDLAAADTAAVTGGSVNVVIKVATGSAQRFWTETVAVAQPEQKSALFPSRAAALASLRNDRLMLAGTTVLGDAIKGLSDEYLWAKILAAESVVTGMLRVPLQPTKFFPKDPTPEQVAALPDGMPWEVDPAYDYDPKNYQGDRWGMISLRQRPVQRIDDLKFVYPAPQHVVLNVPPDWVRVDKKYGVMQVVPTSSPFLSPLGGLVMNSMAGGRMLPFAIEVEYTAGLKDAGRLYPELLDAVQKLAVTKIAEDCFFPSSGSISADGLSESLSVDVSKYHDAVDRIINGAPGSNGGLVARINGIRVMVV